MTLIIVYEGLFITGVYVVPASHRGLLDLKPTPSRMSSYVWVRDRGASREIFPPTRDRVRGVYYSGAQVRAVC